MSIILLQSRVISAEGPVASSPASLSLSLPLSPLCFTFGRDKTQQKWPDLPRHSWEDQAIESAACVTGNHSLATGEPLLNAPGGSPSPG